MQEAFMAHSLVPFFAPRGVAVIGASPNPGKISHGVWHNLTQSGYQGDVYPVNPRYPELAGFPCYPDITDVPDPLDLVVIVLPAPLTPPIVKACGRRGIKAAVIISGGFKEIGPAGAALEAECLALARRHGMRLIGPNCVGIMDLTSALNTTFLTGAPPPGRVGFVSQSGGVCSGGIAYLTGKNIGMSRFVSLGNEADVTETDVIEYLADDPHTGVIAVYVEGIKDGPRLMKVARRVTPHKPIVMLKAGRTAAGGRAVSSHTGALAGSAEACRAAFRQCGIIEAGSMSELFDLSLAMACQPLPAGKRVFVLTNSGGPAALAADTLSAQGLTLPHVSQPTKTALRARLCADIQLANPIDMLGGAGPAEFEFALPHILADSQIDAVLVIVVPHLLLDATETACKIGRVAEFSAKPVLTCFVGDRNVDEARRILHQHNLPMYCFPEIAAQTLSAMSRHANWRQKTNGDAPPPTLTVDRAAVRHVLAQSNATRALGEADTRPILTAYRIPVIPGQVAHSSAEAVDIAAALGGPVALKIVSLDILHKSDAGGIRLNLTGAAAVTAAYRDLMTVAAVTQPRARINGALVEAMAPPGHEVIVGMRRDPQFGPLLMFGLGGIYVELLTDVSFRVAPINRAEALAMIRETKAGKLLSGLRGQPPADINAAANCLLSLSQLALDFPEIVEVEVNPLRVLEHGAVALDGRIILKGDNNGSRTD
jgi:acetyl coenzyme A synthetase (ADP forming)-like protein